MLKQTQEPPAKHDAASVSRFHPLMPNLLWVGLICIVI